MRQVQTFLKQTIKKFIRQKFDKKLKLICLRILQIRKIKHQTKLRSNFIYDKYKTHFQQKLTKSNLRLNKDKIKIIEKKVIKRKSNSQKIESFVFKINHSEMKNYQRHKSKINSLSTQYDGEFNNPFEEISIQKHKNMQFGHRNGSAKLQNIAFSSQSKKPNKIQKAKQLLAQRLKQVTNFQPENQEAHINQENGNTNKRQNIDHLNPISKLTNKPFVRSKTCDQIRKQYSLKKQRKRNNSASKFNTPMTHAGYVGNDSTGLRSTNLQSLKMNSLKNEHNQNNVFQERNEIETRQFSLNPYNYGNVFIETFNEDKIKNLGNTKQKSTKKARQQSFLKINIERQNQISTPISNDLRFPFNINSDFPNNFDSQKKSLNSDINHFQDRIQKFTPKLQRYPLNKQSDSKPLIQNPDRQKLSQDKDKKAGNVPLTALQKISKINNFGKKYPSKQQTHIPTQQRRQDLIHPHFIDECKEQQDIQSSQSQLEQHLNNQADQILSHVQVQYENRGFQKQKQNNQDQPHHQRYSNGNSFHFQHRSVSNISNTPYEAKQLITNLSMTNTILLQKLKLKDMQIDQLTKDYAYAKKQLYCIKQKQTEHQQNYMNYQHQQSQQYSVHQNYSGNFNNSNYHSRNNNNNQYNIYQNKGQQYRQEQILQLPQFQDGIQEQFNRQREIQFNNQSFQNQSSSGQIPLPLSQANSLTNNRPYVSYKNVNLSRFAKRRQLFASDLSQKISEQFQSQQLYLKNKQMTPYKYYQQADSNNRQINDNNSTVLQRYTSSKKSHFYMNQPHQQQDNQKQQQLQQLQQLQQYQKSNQQNDGGIEEYHDQRDQQINERQNNQSLSSNSLKQQKSRNQSKKYIVHSHQSKRNNIDEYHISRQKQGQYNNSSNKSIKSNHNNYLKSSQTINYPKQDQSILLEQDQLIQSGRQKNTSLNFSQQEAISSISPIKIYNTPDKVQMFDYYKKKFLNQYNRISINLEEPLQSKFNYYLTPQKDEVNQKTNPFQEGQQEEGLFSKALTHKKINKTEGKSLHTPIQRQYSTNQKYANEFFNQSDNKNKSLSFKQYMQQNMQQNKQQDKQQSKQQNKQQKRVNVIDSIIQTNIS